MPVFDVFQQRNPVQVADLRRGDSDDVYEANVVRVGSVEAYSPEHAVTLAKRMLTFRIGPFGPLSHWPMVQQAAN